MPVFPGCQPVRGVGSRLPGVGLSPTCNYYPSLWVGSHTTSALALAGVASPGLKMFAEKVLFHKGLRGLVPSFVRRIMAIALGLLDFRLELWKRCPSRSLISEAAISHRGLGGARLAVFII